MILHSHKTVFSFWGGLVAFLVCILFLCCPSVVKSGFTKGCLLCYQHIIPAVFPFFIVIPYILQSPVKKLLSLPLRPICRILKLSHPSAPALLLFSLLGGFAPFCQSLTMVHTQKPFSKRDIRLLLLFGLQLSPSFIVCSIGFAMLHSIALGWILFLSLLLSSFFCALFYSWFLPVEKQKSFVYTPLSSPSVLSFSEIISHASHSTLSLCSFVLFFQILLAFLETAPALLQLTGSVLLEVSSGCCYLLQQNSPYRLYALLACLSFTGISILMQSCFLLPKGTKLTSFLLFRFLHIPLSCVFFKLFLFCFPIALPTIAVTQTYPSFCLDWFQLIALLGMLFSFSYSLRPSSLFTKYKK